MQPVNASNRDAPNTEVAQVAAPHAQNSKKISRECLDVKMCYVINEWRLDERSFQATSSHFSNKADALQAFNEHPLSPEQKAKHYVTLGVSFFNDKINKLHCLMTKGDASVYPSINDTQSAAPIATVDTIVIKVSSAACPLLKKCFEFITRKYPNAVDVSLFHPTSEALSSLPKLKQLRKLSLDNTELDAYVQAGHVSHFQNHCTAKDLLKLSECQKLETLIVQNGDESILSALDTLRDTHPTLKAIKTKNQKQELVTLPFSFVPAKAHTFVSWMSVREGEMNTRNKLCLPLQKVFEGYRHVQNDPSTIQFSAKIVVKRGNDLEEIPLYKLLKNPAVSLQEEAQKKIKKAMVDLETIFGHVEYAKRFCEHLNGLDTVEEVELRSVTKECLGEYQALSHVKRLTINNSNLQPRLTMLQSVGEITHTHVAEPDDNSLNEFVVKMPKLEKITLIGCDKITDAAIEQLNAKGIAHFKVERSAAMK